MSQIRTAAVLSYLSLGINILIGLIYTPWMINSIGRDNFGLYTLALSVISLFVFDFGLSTAVTRFIAKYITDNQSYKIPGFLGIVFKMYFNINAVIVCILVGIYFFIPDIYDKLSPEEIDKFKIVYIIASAFSVISFPFIPLNGILNATEKFIQLKLCDLFQKLFLVATMAICLIAGYGLYALVLVNAIAGLMAIVLKLIIIRHQTSISVNLGYSNKTEQREILSFSGWTTMCSIAQRLMLSLAPSILGIVSGAASIAILGIAITIEGYTFSFAYAINGLFLPKVTRIIKGNKSELLTLMIKVGRLQLVIILMIFIVFIIIGQKFIQLWVGSQFLNSYWCAVLLLVPSIFHLPQEIAHTAIIASNKIKYQAYVYAIMCIINLILAFVFGLKWAAIGVAASICIAYLIRTIGLSYIYVSKLDINIWSFFKKVYCPMIIPCVLTFISGYFINKCFDTSWFSFLAEGLIFVSIFALLLLIFYFTKDDKAMLSGFVKIRK